MDIVGISGLLISIGGFGLSLWQLRHTRRAAEAAASAAQEAVRAMRLVDTVATIHDICGRSRDLLYLAREGSLNAAAVAAFELLDLVARFHVTASARALAPQIHWQAIIEKTGQLHEDLELAAKTNSLSVPDALELIKTISQIHSQLSSFATIAGERGVHHGNS